MPPSLDAFFLGIFAVNFNLTRHTLIDGEAQLDQVIQRQTTKIRNRHRLYQLLRLLFHVEHGCADRDAVLFTARVTLSSGLTRTRACTCSGKQTDHKTRENLTCFAGTNIFCNIRTNKDTFTNNKQARRLKSFITHSPTTFRAIFARIFAHYGGIFSITAGRSILGLRLAGQAPVAGIAL